MEEEEASVTLEVQQTVQEISGRTLYSWQERAIRETAGRNAVLSAPTGSGKTWVAYIWSGLFYPDGARHQPSAGEKVIFTAPIKALSNERYMDLIGMGFDVGIETGDFKKNTGASIICCTQEIYALKYAGTSGLRLVIDEFHYIFGDNDRSRAYIDGIRKTAPDVPILVMSATFGGAERVQSYLERVTNRAFALFQSSYRVTELKFCDEPVTPRDIRDALVFVFSQKGTQQVADLIANHRLRFDDSRKHRLEDLAWILEVSSIRRCMFKGVGLYHGSLLPKEKLLVERAYRERIIDVVVGTDALALGVNLPAEKVVFGQLVSFHDRRPISKNAFLQMAGRAGRKGLFEKGYVTWLEGSPAESFGVSTGEMFQTLSDAAMEEAAVTLKPDVGAILKRRRTVETEAEIVAFGSLPEQNYRQVLGDIRLAMDVIDQSIHRVPSSERDRFRSILADLWYGEMETEQNLEMAELFLWGTGKQGEYTHPDGLTAADRLGPRERNRLQALLKVKRFNNSLPDEYKFTGMDAVEDAIMDIDPTVFGFEEKYREMETTKVDLPELNLKMAQNVVERRKKRLSKQTVQKNRHAEKSGTGKIKDSSWHHSRKKRPRRRRSS
ncbi:MAG: DEAD/DEAH box helicase [Dethiosulfovibrio peptidovorans]|nr:MAG: DEAD/DEAH box helicase [Dethiosulfovibrio peptidovorans]